MFKNNKGFTLLEVIIAISILAMVVGTLLRSFAFSAKLNKRAYDTNMANALALSEAEEIKKDCEAYIGVVNQKIEVEYFDIQWNSLGNTDSADAKFVREVKVEKVKKEGRMNSYMENTYMDDERVHIMVPNELAIVGVLHEEYSSGAKANREYKLNTYSFTQNRRADIARGLMKWKKYIDDEEKKSRKLSGTELVNKFREGLYWYMPYIKAPNGENNYSIGNLKSGYTLGDQDEVRGQGIDELKVTDAIPITFLCREDTMKQAVTYKIYLVNLTNKNVDVYVQYIRDGSNTSVFSRVQVEIENGMDLIKEEIDINPTSYSENYEYILGYEYGKYGNIRSMSNYFTQTDNTDTYTIDVSMKRKEDDVLLGSYHTQEYEMDLSR
ncbi:MAG: prepilin-type N-terminal cleavage/methylation domain-containing protein [Marinisporobacter sp.]|jgi:prepilin-type N-terminal cleavage/methylation domain-containing protein|nr:prepilin-type N-terminal cleavage/methylation domain-containing protein [Marinisporobacter sp.]